MKWDSSKREIYLKAHSFIEKSEKKRQQFIYHFSLNRIETDLMCSQCRSRPACASTDLHCEKGYAPSIYSDEPEDSCRLISFHCLHKGTLAVQRVPNKDYGDVQTDLSAQKSHVRRYIFSQFS